MLLMRYNLFKDYIFDANVDKITSNLLAFSHTVKKEKFL